MVAVFRCIEYVIQDVRGAGDQAEHQSGQQDLPATVPAREALGKNKGGKDESILDPLLRAQRFHQRPQRGAAVAGCGLNR